MQKKKKYNDSPMIINMADLMPKDPRIDRDPN